MTELLINKKVQGTIACFKVSNHKVVYDNLQKAYFFSLKKPLKLSFTTLKFAHAASLKKRKERRELPTFLK